jgi:hypothetical protein
LSRHLTVLSGVLFARSRLVVRGAILGSVSELVVIVRKPED